MRYKNVPAEFVKLANQPENGFTAFEGYASTWDKDLGGDTILPGAFTDTIKQRLPRNLIKVRWMHFDPFGLCTAAGEDTKGLYVKGKAPNTKTNMERIELMQAKVVDRLSIGYDFPNEEAYQWQEDGTMFGERIINKVDLYEWSPVDLAMNENTTVQMAKSLMSMGITLPQEMQKYIMSQLNGRIDIKGPTSFGDLPLASRERAWDNTAAEKRVRSWANAEDAPNAQYRKAFMWYDSENADNFTGYKLGFADVIDGKLTAIPRGIFAVAAVLQGSRGGVNIPDNDVSGVKSHVEKYYAKMRREFDDDSIIAPWNQDSFTANSSKSYTVNIWQDGKLLESKIVTSDAELETKIGAELSKKNRTKLQQARDLVDEVLTASEETNPENTDSEKDKKSNEWEETDFTDIFDEINDFIAGRNRN